MNVVALFSDKHMLPGLHVTLLSLLQNLSLEWAPRTKVILFLDKVSKGEQNLLRETHQVSHKGSLLEIVEYTPTSPTGGDLLHGNATAYGRLNLPHLLPDEKKCVYLDCDLIVNRCISGIFEHFDNEHILLVDGEGKRNSSLDKLLFKKAGLDMAGACFNSGVMGINLELWRARNVDSLIEAAATKFQGMFKSADQALLNVALHSSFKSIGNDFNTALFPNSLSCRVSKKRIYHFVGSPKPWDVFGSFSSNHYEMWKSVYKGTAIGRKWHLRYTTLRRSFYVSKQSLRAFKTSIQQRKEAKSGFRISSRNATKTETKQH